MSMLNELRPLEAQERDRSFMGRIKELLPWKGDDAKEIIRKTVYLTAIAVLIYSFYSVYVYKFGTSDLHENKDFLSGLYHGDSSDSDSVVPPADSDKDDTQENPAVGDNIQDNPSSPGDTLPDDSDPGSTEPVVDSKYPAGMNQKFEALYDINSDIIGWLKIDNLTDSDGNSYIDYPVMQCSDNDFYIDHDFFKQEKNYGALFADYHIKITQTSHPRNTVIYGHNMGAGTYFSHLHDYKKRASFVSEHRLINFSTLYEENDYIIVGCFLIGIREDQDNNPLFRYHLIFDFENISDFDYWYKNVMYRSYYLTDIECGMDDEYITLSTCSTEFYDSRFVIVARKVREGEDPFVYNYYSNPNARKPAAFYKAYNMKVPDDDGPDYEYYGKDNQES